MVNPNRESRFCANSTQDRGGWGALFWQNFIPMTISDDLDTSIPADEPNAAPLPQKAVAP